jgi:hypothetical protein
MADGVACYNEIGPQQAAEFVRAVSAGIARAPFKPSTVAA